MIDNQLKNVLFERALVTAESFLSQARVVLENKFFEQNAQETSQKCIHFLLNKAKEILVNLIKNSKVIRKRRQG